MDKNKKFVPVDWKKYFLVKNSSVKKYLSKYGLKFIEQTFLKIKSAHKSKKPYTILIRFQHNTDMAVVIYQNEYEYALKVLLDFCIDIEYYEMCEQIHTYTQSINKGRRKYVIKKEVMETV
jgi:hypothetical protein